MYNGVASGNNFLYRLLDVGKFKVVPTGSDMNEEMNQLADELENARRKAYVIPVGGSNEIGTLGYITCVEEIVAQTLDLGSGMNHVVSVVGSGSAFA